MTDEGRKQAKEWAVKKLCGMVSFADGYIFSCDLRNATKEENDVAAVEHAGEQVSRAMEDPSEVRLMECLGVNPWKQKPEGWAPPTEKECADLQRKLVADAESKDPSPSPRQPPMAPEPSKTGSNIRQNPQ